MWSVALYGADTWTVLMTERAKIEAFEAWRWRKTLKISLMEKVKEMLRFLR